jgi:hypothetical protein
VATFGLATSTAAVVTTHIARIGAALIASRATIVGIEKLARLGNWQVRIAGDSKRWRRGRRVLRRIAR